MGYSLSTPDQSTYMVVGLTIFVLALPAFIRWHHILLIFFWNAAFDFPFLPAQPHFWLLLATLSFAISWLNGLLGGSKFTKVPELTRPLLFLAAVVFLTGYLRGGVGARVFGSSSYGGKTYFYIFGAIMGYFALSAVRIPVGKASRAAGLFFASGVTAALSNLAFALGPAFSFLFYLLPSDSVIGQAVAQSGLQPGTVERLSGVTPACTALICYFLVRWGIRGIFSLVHPWRLILFVAMLLLSLLGGFRSAEIMIAVVFLCQFCLEGVWRTRLAPIFAGAALALVMVLFAVSDRIPLVAQRAICFLPVKIDPGVRADAEGSVEWRLEMWRFLVPQIPKYLLLGKGYAIDPTELYFADLGAQLGQNSSSESSLVAGNYHSGPLSTIVPLGLAGTVGLLWLFVAGIKVLYRNYRYGDPRLRHINTFLLAYFVTEVIMFIAVFGAFNSQLCLFTGVLGISVALNGVVRRPSLARAAVPESIRVPSQVTVPV